MGSGLVFIADDAGNANVTQNSENYAFSFFQSFLTSAYGPGNSFGGPGHFDIVLEASRSGQLLADNHIQVDVNTPPVAGNDGASVTEDVVLSASGNVLGNDNDADGDSLSVSAASTGLRHGTYGDLTLNANGNHVSTTYGAADYNGIFFLNAGGSIDDVTVVGIHDPYNLDGSLNGTQRGNAIVVANRDGNARTVEVSNSDVSDFQKTGMVFAGNGLTVDVHGNHVSGSGLQPLGSPAQNGIQVSGGATGTLDGNTIDSLGYGPDSFSASPASWCLVRTIAGDERRRVDGRQLAERGHRLRQRRQPDRQRQLGRRHLRHVPARRLHQRAEPRRQYVQRQRGRHRLLSGPGRPGLRVHR